MLTTPQNEQLASALCGTRRSVYSLARALYDYGFKDEDYDRLKAETGVFRCVECWEWFDIEHEAAADGTPNLCDRCRTED